MLEGFLFDYKLYAILFISGTMVRWKVLGKIDKRRHEYFTLKNVNVSISSFLKEQCIKLPVCFLG